MNIKKQPLPREVEAAIPELLPQIVEYLELEQSESFQINDLKFSGYYTGDNAVGFLVFEYESAAGSEFAFVQHSLTNGQIEDGCIGCWPRTSGQSIEWSLREYREYNPHLGPG